MKKLTNKKGFTLMEMIIVVAIIAILAVVTIPTLTGNTAKAEKAADAANLRSAKAAYQVLVLEDRKPAADAIFNPSTGEFDGTAETGKCGQCTEHKDGYIKVDSTGKVVWSKGDATCD